MEFNNNRVDAIVGGWELTRMAELERARQAGGANGEVVKPQAPRYYEEAAVAGVLATNQFVMGGELIQG